MQIKKIFIILLITVVLLTSEFLNIQRAEAAVPVFEIGANLAVNTITLAMTTELQLKEWVTDLLAWVATTKILEIFTQMTVNWINSGFNGSPTFVTNPQSYFTDLFDESTRIFLNEVSQTSSPFANTMTQLFQAHQSYATSPNSFQTTMSRNQLPNLQQFYGDFSAGGWNSWLQMVDNPSNNPYDAYLRSHDEWQRRSQITMERGKNELQQGQGFLTLKECAQEDNAGNCIDWQNTTPGKVIVDNLSKALGMPMERIANADELQEVIGDILTDLVNQLINQGLRYIS
ncbi:MAG: hypothetical protein AB1643_01005 [Patescibacteria group bacterium]